MNNTIIVLGIVGRLILGGAFAQDDYVITKPNDTSTQNFRLEEVLSGPEVNNGENLVVGDDPLYGPSHQANDLMEIFTEESDAMRNYIIVDYLMPSGNFIDSFKSLHLLLDLGQESETVAPEHFQGYIKIFDTLEKEYDNGLGESHAYAVRSAITLLDTVESNYKLMQKYHEEGDIEEMSDLARETNHQYLDLLENITCTLQSDLKALSKVMGFIETQPSDPITALVVNDTNALIQNRLELMSVTQSLYQELQQSSFETCDNLYSITNGS
ncbi:hypothetical protein HN695_07650 [Candidatus Woesearchaeota archaeon]|jgi:hypothetical protein|nr:hypothetical protein [Candidatus Woesearchaeota archaeon]MBT5272628.1 hypothetical protein [Candidatus Woesearchaeota archaeon]MBT6041735.1 hypothetical protein [Candidatus Woesearchaeota archaeon]MBT6337180.1 hypothetical protein [Candidatus Woesearchaeota archaeon]MBT7928182.1 hypothetical protein [Candidatus Woesearchaeota archaeon]